MMGRKRAGTGVGEDRPKESGCRKAGMARGVGHRAVASRGCWRASTGARCDGMCNRGDGPREGKNRDERERATGRQGQKQQARVGIRIGGW